MSPMHHTWLEGKSCLSASGTELSCQIVVAGQRFEHTAPLHAVCRDMSPGLLLGRMKV